MPSIEINCVDFCRALADETRQQILQLLVAGDCCVGNLVEQLDLAQPTISHHLGILKNLGLVDRRREGKRIFYSLNRDNVVECCGMLFSKFGCETGEGTVEVTCATE
jgi:ArsR family transcriptional regulator